MIEGQQEKTTAANLLSTGDYNRAVADAVAQVQEAKDRLQVVAALVEEEKS